MNSLSFDHYIRLYTLHQIEQPPDMLLTMRIAVLRYSFVLLDRPAVDAAYASDPREGALMVRQSVLPRLLTLLDSHDPFGELEQIGGQDAAWRQYAALRGVPADLVPVPAIRPMHSARIPARSATAARLAQAQRALELIQTAAETTATLAALWQNWQIGRERRKLVETQRLLLQDSIQSQLAVQDDALQRGLDRGYVRGYLAAHAGDPAAALLEPPERTPD
jgi:hypothetical protein